MPVKINVNKAKMIDDTDITIHASYYEDDVNKTKKIFKMVDKNTKKEICLEFKKVENINKIINFLEVIKKDLIEENNENINQHKTRKVIKLNELK
ncbi:MAG: hypothetical protein ACOCP8_09750 [archaeon]